MEKSGLRKLSIVDEIILGKTRFKELEIIERDIIPIISPR